MIRASCWLFKKESITMHGNMNVMLSTGRTDVSNSKELCSKLRNTMESLLLTL